MAAMATMAARKCGVTRGAAAVVAENKKGHGLRTRTHAAAARRVTAAAVTGEGWQPTESGLVLPPFPPDEVVSAGRDAVRMAGSPATATPGGGYSAHKASSPPPDLPSLLLDSRIVYLGMPMVPAVTELIIAELLYLQYADRFKPIYVYINSTGCSRADGETVSMETEAYALFDTLNYVSCPIHTIGVGVAVGQAALILASGKKGERYMLPHSTVMMQQPRVPDSGQQQASEIEIKWKEVLANKKISLELLAEATGQSVPQLDKDMQRPNYMTARQAIAYGVADKILAKGEEQVGGVKSAVEWDKEAGIVQKQAPQAGPAGM